MSRERHSIPELRIPSIRFQTMHAGALGDKHQKAHHAALRELKRITELDTGGSIDKHDKLLVCVAVKLKGIPEPIVAHNTRKHHAEEKLAAEMLRLKQREYVGRPFPKIQSFVLVSSGSEQRAHTLSQKKIRVDALPEGTPCMCPTCLKLWRVLRRELYPEPVRAAEDNDTSFARRTKRWKRLKNFPVTIGLTDEIVIRTDFKSAPLLEFPGSVRTKTASERLGGLLADDSTPR